MKKGPQHPLVTYSAAQDCDDFRIPRHLGGEEDDGDENEQRTVQVYKAWNEVQVVAEDNLFYRGMVVQKVVQLLRYIKGDDDDYYQRQGQYEGLQILGKDVPVKLFVVFKLHGPSSLLVPRSC